MGFVPWTQAIVDDVFSHARRSIQMEDADEYCHWAMACGHLLKEEHARALTSLQQALAINPHCSLAHGSMGTVLAWAGQPEEAIKSNELALRMNPDDPANFFRHLGLALAHYLASRHDQALSHATLVLQMRPQWWLGLILNAANLAQLDRMRDAHRVVGDLDAIRPGVTCQTLRILPFANPRDREYLLDGLRKAGLPQGV
jgi:tetratricopeptide (TPR) repeat protein